MYILLFHTVLLNCFIYRRDKAGYGQRNFYSFDQKNVSFLSNYILPNQKKNLITRKVMLT